MQQDSNALKLNSEAPLKNEDNSVTRSKDLVDQVIANWQNTILADTDFTGTEIIGRIVRMDSFIGKMIDDNLSRYRMNIGDFNILAVLLREKTHQLTPGRIQEMVFVSSGGLSNRMIRLEEKGLIARSTDPSDRRGVIVTLTDAGRELIERAAPSHMALENSLITNLNESEQETLIQLLRKMLQHVESEAV